MTFGSGFGLNLESNKLYIWLSGRKSWNKRNCSFGNFKPIKKLAFS